ncbi:MAG: aminotransferase class III-fold pyridoxal phosphate-dependent enzyme [Clostridia bacterium]|nr:aminotransferase class III-fold pyridoxal phosphate-dependent enzyme [Clostridia bacterium]
MERYLAPSLAVDWPGLRVERAEGARVTAADGRVYLDFVSGMAALPLGHGHPEVVAAVREQAERLLHGPLGVFYYDVLLDLAEELAAVLPGGIATFFFGNSGTEAVEGAVKLARFVTGRPMVVAFRGGFHGRSLGSLALTASKAFYRHGYQPLPGVVHSRFPYPLADGLAPEASVAAALEELDALFRHVVAPEDVAAIVVEPVQGEGGYVVPPRGFLEGLRERADRSGALLVFDEVQTGFGRTGDFFAAETFGVTPDVMALAKAISSGLPLGATAARPELMARWPAGTHGTTFGGSPLAAAAALATLRVLRRERLPERARRLGEAARAELWRLAGRHPGLVREVRGPGLMIGIECASGELATRVLRAALERGLILYPAGPDGRVIRFIPPLNVPEADLEEGLEILGRAFDEVAGRP